MWLTADAPLCCPDHYPADYIKNAHFEEMRTYRQPEVVLYKCALSAGVLLGLRPCAGGGQSR